MREAKIVNMAINKIVRKHFQKQATRSTKSHELHQFASLFDTNYLNKLAQLFYRSDNHTPNNMPTNYYVVDVGWIDKKPLAEFATQNLTKRVELGDALVFYNHYSINQPSNQFKVISERAVIIQEKITKNKTRIPKVTVTSDDSSKKEYALYSRWPSFRLQRRGIYSLQFNLPSNANLKNPYPYAFYLAARKSYSKDEKWPCHWMASPSIKSERCGIPAGEILFALKSGNLVNGYQVGEKLEANQEWARLVRFVLMKVSLGWTNTGWCGRIMPTRTKGGYAQFLTQQTPDIVTNEFYPTFGLGMQYRGKASILRRIRPWHPARHRDVIHDSPGKFMVLRVTRVSSDFESEPERYFND